MVGRILASCVRARALAGGLHFRRGYRRNHRERPSSWNINRAAALLSQKIKDSGFNPDIVVSGGKWGSAIAAMLVGKLGLISVTSLRVKQDWATGDPGNRLQYLPQNLRVDGLRVLLVMGAVNTGERLRQAFEYLSAKAPKALKTASIFRVETGIFIPDYYVYQVKSVEEIPVWRK